MELCQYCNENIINGSLCKLYIESIHNEKIENKCCNRCLYFLKIAQVIFYLPYKYMIYNSKVFEIATTLDISGKLVYIKFNDGKIIKEFTNRLIEIGTIPEKLTKIIKDNCVITEAKNVKKVTLPNYITVKGT